MRREERMQVKLRETPYWSRAREGVPASGAIQQLPARESPRKSLAAGDLEKHRDRASRQISRRVPGLSNTESKESAAVLRLQLPSAV